MNSPREESVHHLEYAETTGQPMSVPLDEREAERLAVWHAENIGTDSEFENRHQTLAVVRRSRNPARPGRSGASP